MMKKNHQNHAILISFSYTKFAADNQEKGIYRSSMEAYLYVSSRWDSRRIMQV